jgi:hypothetical protein
MHTFILILTGFIGWLVTTSLAYKFSTEIVENISMFNYKPFNCFKCFQAWANFLVNIVLLVSFNTWLINLTWIILATLNTIAIIIDEKQKFVE